MDLNILFIFGQELLEKPEDKHLRAHIISTFVAVDDLTKTSRVTWTFEEPVVQLSLFTSSSDPNFSLGLAEKQVIDLVADWCFLHKNRREKLVKDKEGRQGLALFCFVTDQYVIIQNIAGPCCSSLVLTNVFLLTCPYWFSLLICP